MNCPECGRKHPPEPEFCPLAVWYSSGPTGGACEAYWLTTPDGRADTAGIPYGSELYYQLVIEGTALMHEVGECRA